MLLKWKPKKRCSGGSAAQESMDKLSVGYCDTLHAAVGFVTEIVAGHVVSIRKETR